MAAELKPLPASVSVELTPTSSNEQLFPTFYRRAPAKLLDDRPETGGSGAVPTASDADRVAFKPIPEKHRLGYISTSALIIGKVVGSGIFRKPNSVMMDSGGKGAALILWTAGGLMSLAG